MPSADIFTKHEDDDVTEFGSGDTPGRNFPYVCKEIYCKWIFWLFLWKNAHCTKNAKSNPFNFRKKIIFSEVGGDRTLLVIQWERMNILILPTSVRYTCPLFCEMYFKKLFSEKKGKNGNFFDATRVT